MEFTLSSLPTTLAELKAMPEAKMKSPEATAALTIAALCVYPSNKEEAIDMLNYLKGPQPLSTYEKQFLADRFRDTDYVPRSYFKSATVDNGYTVTAPYTIVFVDNPHSTDQLSEGYYSLYPKSNGADSPRQIKLRTKPSTGEWFLWEQMILSGIRVPKALDPWA